MMKDNREDYKTEAIPKMRRFTLDAGYIGRRRHIVHGLIEADVTVAADAKGKIAYPGRADCGPERAEVGSHNTGMLADGE